MNEMGETYPQTFSIDQSRRARLIEEITVAVNGTPKRELQDWGSRIPVTMSKVTIRRCKNLGNMLVNLGTGAINEGSWAIRAFREGNLKEHMRGRGRAASESIKNAGLAANNVLRQLSSSLRKDPAQEIPKLAVGVIGFFAASGGVDGDGGVPDLDFLGGIGDHRSIFTHSVIAGAVIETLLVSITDLTKTVHRNLPDDHGPIWENLIAGNEKILKALSQGMSAGIAYHLGVDATIDGDGTYKDLPISLPQDVHQVIIGSNAVAEGVDAVKRNENAR